MNWQPIASAPRDGRHFLTVQRITFDEFDEEGMLWRKSVVERKAVVAYFAFGGIASYPFTGSMPTNIEYTHWQSLPALP